MQDKEGENKYDSSGSSLNAFIHKKNKNKSSIQYTAGSMARNFDDFDARAYTYSTSTAHDTSSGMNFSFKTNKIYIF